MPRAKKTIGNMTPQKVEAFTGQTYGMATQQEGLQRAMPAPSVGDTPMPSTAQEPVSAPQESVQAMPTAPRTLDINALRQTLAGVGGQLTRPDDQPNRPFNDRLNDPMGPMSAPIVNRTGQIMRDLTTRTGDPMFAELAARAGI